MKDKKFIRDTKLKLPIEFVSEDLNKNYSGEVLFNDEEDLSIYEGDIAILSLLSRFGSPSAADVKFGGRYGTSISINDSLHWELSLLSRISKNIHGNSFSIPELISSFTSAVVDQKLTKYQSYKLEQTNNDYSEIVLNLIRVIIVESKQLEGSEDFIEEFKISELTFNPVPAVRFLFLSIFEPTLLLPDEWRTIRDSFPELREDEGLSNLLDILDSEDGEVFFMQSVYKHSDAIKNSISNMKINWIRAKGLAENEIKKALKFETTKKESKKKFENFALLNSYSLYVAYLNMSFDENISNPPEQVLEMSWPTLCKMSKSAGKIIFKPKEDGLMSSMKEGFKFGYGEAMAEEKLKKKNIKPKRKT